MAATHGPRLIKKYPNRRLYDTRTSTYITLSDIKELVLSQEEFQVVDAKSSEDLTRSVLLQIILEEEAAGAPMFSTTMLAQVIRFYGNAMQGVMGTVLEKNIQAFIDMQEKFQKQSKAFQPNAGLLNQEAWTQFMAGQAPMMQNLMGRYIEQTQQAFLQMEEQFQSNARSMMSGFVKNRDGPGGTEKK